jgi:hypothetical protein
VGQALEGDVRRSERGVQYPADNLEAALEMLAKARDAIGFGAASRETIAEALGHKTLSGTSSRKIAVLTHFDLLERVSTGAYRISDLGKAILLPKDDRERLVAVSDAAKRPALFGALVERYKGHALPTMLPNLLSREHGVFAGSSEAAARTFRETMEYAALLRHGVLYEEPEVAAATNPMHREHIGGIVEQGSDAGTPVQVAGGAAAAIALSGTTQAYTIPLDNSGRLATIQIPIPVKTRDLKKIRAWVDYMSSVVDEEDVVDA